MAQHKVNADRIAATVKMSTLDFPSWAASPYSSGYGFNHDFVVIHGNAVPNNFSQISLRFGDQRYYVGRIYHSSELPPHSQFFESGNWKPLEKEEETNLVYVRLYQKRDSGFYRGFEESIYTIRVRTSAVFAYREFNRNGPYFVRSNDDFVVGDVVFKVHGGDVSNHVPPEKSEDAVTFRVPPKEKAEYKSFYIVIDIDQTGYTLYHLVNFKDISPVLLKRHVAEILSVRGYVGLEGATKRLQERKDSAKELSTGEHIKVVTDISKYRSIRALDFGTSYPTIEKDGKTIECFVRIAVNPPLYLSFCNQAQCRYFAFSDEAKSTQCFLHLKDEKEKAKRLMSRYVTFPPPATLPKYEPARKRHTPCDVKTCNGKVPGEVSNEIVARCELHGWLKCYFPGCSKTVTLGRASTAPTFCIEDEAKMRGIMQEFLLET